MSYKGYVFWDVPVEIERENGFWNESLVDHVVEDGWYSVDGYGWEAKAEDAIEFSSEEGQTRLTDRFGECLVFDVKSTDLKNVSP